MDVLKYLVTGTGRCGTVYFAKLLTSLGIPCGHESIFDWQGIDGALKRLNHEEPKVLSEISQYNCKSPNWINPDTIIAESSYMAAPYLDHEIFKETYIVHVVRNPVDVVNSFCNYLDYFKDPNSPKEEWENFIYTQLPELKDESLTIYDRGCLYYIKWNQMIENKLSNRGYCFHHIEDDVLNVLNFLEVKPTENMFNDKTANTLKKQTKQFEIPLIQNQNIKKDFVKIGKKYGYKMLSKNLFI